MRLLAPTSYIMIVQLNLFRLHPSHTYRPHIAKPQRWNAVGIRLNYRHWTLPILTRKYYKLSPLESWKIFRVSWR